MTPLDPSAPDDLPEGVDDVTVQAVRDACDREAGKLIAEIRRSLDYYLTQTSQVRTVPTVLLTGSPSQLRNLPAQLEAGLHAVVLPADPLERIQSTSKTCAAIEADRYGAAAAIGLAMGGLQS
jgi:Tfp pilus assembly PilM family ATPase